MKLTILIGELFLLTCLLCLAASAWVGGPVAALILFLVGSLSVLMVVDKILGF